MDILHLYLSPIRNESRLLKQCGSARQRWDSLRIRIVGLWEAGLSVDETTPDGSGIHRVRVRTRGLPKLAPLQLLKYAEWVIRTVLRYRADDVSIVHVHGLAALLPGWILKKLTGAALLYEAPELEAKKSSRNSVRARFAGVLERRLIGRTDARITVSHAIAAWYAQSYGIQPPVVVRNIPDISMQRESPGETVRIRETFGIGDDELVFIYQGMLSRPRALPRFLEVFEQVAGRHHLVFLGYGPMEGEIREKARSVSNIHFLPAVPPDQVLAVTATADVGICGMGTGSLSYRLSLPNKFFEYLVAGLPVVIGDRPEQAEIVDTFDCGWSVGESNSEFVELIRSIDRAAIDRKSAGARRAREKLSWDAEANKLLGVYATLQAERPGP